MISAVPQQCVPLVEHESTVLAQASPDAVGRPITDEISLELVRRSAVQA